MARNYKKLEHIGSYLKLFELARRNGKKQGEAGRSRKKREETGTNWE